MRRVKVAPTQAEKVRARCARRQPLQQQHLTAADSCMTSCRPSPQDKLVLGIDPLRRGVIRACQQHQPAVRDQAAQVRPRRAQCSCRCVTSS